MLLLLFWLSLIASSDAKLVRKRKPVNPLEARYRYKFVSDQPLQIENEDDEILQYMVDAVERSDNHYVKEHNCQDTLELIFDKFTIDKKTLWGESHKVVRNVDVVKDLDDTLNAIFNEVEKAGHEDSIAIVHDHRYHFFMIRASKSFWYDDYEYQLIHTWRQSFSLRNWLTPANPELKNPTIQDLCEAGRSHSELCWSRGKRKSLSVEKPRQRKVKSPMIKLLGHAQRFEQEDFRKKIKEAKKYGLWKGQFNYVAIGQATLFRVLYPEFKIPVKDPSPVTDPRLKLRKHAPKQHHYYGTPAKLGVGYDESKYPMHSAKHPKHPNNKLREMKWKEDL